MNILIGVVTSSLNKDRQETINKTWNSKKYQNVNVLFLSDENNEPNKVFKFSKSSDYKSAEEKVLNFLRSLKENNIGDWYFIVDDDTYVHIENLIEFIYSADPNYVYGFAAQKDWWNGLEYLQGGAGTLISHQTIKNIQEDTIINYNTGFCDVALGLIFKSNNIKVKGCNEPNTCLFLEKSFNHYSSIGKEKLLKKITFHQIRTYDEMKSIEDFYNGA